MDDLKLKVLPSGTGDFKILKSNEINYTVTENETQVHEKRLKAQWTC